MANLQEEIFESEDFKQVEDAKDDTDEQNEQLLPSSNVIEERIEPSKAFQIYAGQLYDPSTSSQTNDRHKRNNIGKSSRIYDTTQSSDINFESPLQTYKRLQFEIEQFKQKLQEITDKVCYIYVYIDHKAHTKAHVFLSVIYVLYAYI